MTKPSEGKANEKDSKVDKDQIIADLKRQISLSKDAKNLFELESKVSSLMTEKLILNKKLKVAAKEHGIFKAIVDELQTCVTTFDPLPKAPVFPGAKEIEEHLVMVLSDEHADELIDPIQVGGLERFDFKVALCRAEEFVDTTIKFTKQTLANYNFKNLTIFCLGDATSAEIHGAITRSEYGNIFRNCLAIGQMRALMLRDLAAHFEKVNIICLSGNHGRRTIKKDFNGALNNWDYLVSEIAKLHCADIKNLHFQIPDCFSVIVDIENFGFHLQHGDDILSWNNLPWYGIERKTRRLVALHHATGTKVNHFVLGHFHAATQMSDLKGEVLINGAWPATNAYSYESFSGYREPTQMIFGVNKVHGITWRLNIKLKNEEKERKGPSRYGVILSDREYHG